MYIALAPCKVFLALCNDTLLAGVLLLDYWYLGKV